MKSTVDMKFVSTVSRLCAGYDRGGEGCRCVEGTLASLCDIASRFCADRIIRHRLFIGRSAGGTASGRFVASRVIGYTQLGKIEVGVRTDRGRRLPPRCPR